MATVKKFEGLECWKEARRLVNMVYLCVRKGEFSKDFELSNQIKRSAISVMANIAEGFHRRSNKDFMKFLDYSRSSIAETLSHCFIARDQNYIDKIELAKLRDQAELVWKKMNSFISYLNREANRTNLTIKTI